MHRNSQVSAVDASSQNIKQLWFSQDFYERKLKSNISIFTLEQVTICSMLIRKQLTLISRRPYLYKKTQPVFKAIFYKLFQDGMIQDL